MNCPNCSTPNADGEQFCAACGTELANAVPQPPSVPSAATTSQSPTAPPPPPASPAIITVGHVGKDFPLFEGSKFLIARNDTTKCKPDLPLDGDGVSSSPVEIAVTSGKTTVTNNGSVAIQVAILLDAGQSLDVKPGDMLVMGGGGHIITLT
jgi:hypothetical protein